MCVCFLFFSFLGRFLFRSESKKKVLSALCFCVQLFTETVGRGLTGLRCGGGGEGEGGGGGCQGIRGISTRAISIPDPDGSKHKKGLSKSPRRRCQTENDENLLLDRESFIF